MAGRIVLAVVALAFGVGIAGTSAPAQDAPGAGPIPTPDPPPVDPTVPDEPPPAPPDRLAAIEARLQALEEQNRRLSEENAELRRLVDVPEGDGSGAPAAVVPGDTPAVVTAPGPAAAIAPGSPAGTSFESRPDSPVPGYIGVTEESPDDRASLLGSFGQGFEFKSEDEEYLLQVHLESQVDYRAFDPNGEVFARDGIYSPRNRIFFGGRVTKSVEYLFSINKGFGDLNLLDAWANFRRDDRLQLRIGRYMTPFNYEQFAVQNMWLIAPERSLFTSNLGLNRQFGAMLWGTVLDKRLDYALGLFNGPRNSYDDFNESKDLIGYLNARPFQEMAEGSVLRFLNLGGSFSYGDQENPLVPASFRLATNASNVGAADRPAPPFLVFNSGAIERGQRSFWSAHLAYFYRSLSVIADYNGSIQRYARPATAPASVVLPVNGMSVAAGYFLTGEQIERRTIVEPLRPFRLKRGEFGMGAVELVGRYSTFDIDSDVFASGLADRDLWSNRAWVTNLGLNWYPNKFVKVYLDWQHGEFGDPVFFAPGRQALTNNLFWLRCQLYF